MSDPTTDAEAAEAAPGLDLKAEHMRLLVVVNARLAVRQDPVMRRIRDRLEQTIELLS